MAGLFGMRASEAQKRANRNWYLKNRERQIQKAMEYQEKIGKEKVLENNKRWRENLSEEQKAIRKKKNREWYRNLPEEKKIEYRIRVSAYWKRKKVAVVE